jgi:hypothetical protein
VDRVGGQGLRAINIFPNVTETEPSLPCSQDAETDRNYISNYIIFNSQGAMTARTSLGTAASDGSVVRI